jgi:GMP synthase (glutamine-hydrolysing)
MFSDDQKVLFVQLRPDAMRDHEREVFLKHASLSPEQAVFLDVFEDEISEAMLDGVDALVIGGSGDFLLSRGDIPEHIAAVSELARAARERGMPILGICFGGQILSQAFGGKVVHGPDRKEMGTFELTRSPNAVHCPVFKELPERFHAQLGHQDHIDEIPEGAVHLASSELSHHQAWTFPGEPMYALTFHPELDEDAMHYRINFYADEYGLDEPTLEEMRGGIFAAPEAVRVIRLFLDRVVGEGRRFPREAHVEAVSRKNRGVLAAGATAGQARIVV